MAVVQRRTLPSSNHSPTEYKGFAVFNDLSIRKEGVYRLEFHAFEVAAGLIRHVGSIQSQEFTVYVPKDFPGMSKSTRCTEQLRNQGFRLRVNRNIRKDVRDPGGEACSKP